jgi:hypothetical protein
MTENYSSTKEVKKKGVDLQQGWVNSSLRKTDLLPTHTYPQPD